MSAAAQDDFTPAWSKKVVWYQIFPERFRNGDTKNDPTIKSLYSSDSTSAWQVHPWGSDWYELQPYEKQNGKDFWYNVQRRRYGGDLQGVIDKLDYLKQLGIGAIYLNPVFWAPSMHKYDAICYHHVDPYFGPDPEGDKKLIATEDPSNPSTWHWTEADKLLLKLIDEVHKRGMYLILDGVFNHMGTQNFFFKDVVKNQERSKYKDWFDIISFADKQKGTEFDYKGWFGHKGLPELKEDTNGIVTGPREYIFAITKRWLNPDGKGVEHGCDGWRLDVAFCIHHQFWRDWRVLVKGINPNAYITAELPFNDTPDKLAPYLQGDEFDGIMNYNFAINCYEYIMADKTRVKPSVLDQNLENLRSAFPECATHSVLNLLDSHDTNRLSSMIANADNIDMRVYDKYADFSKVQKDEKYNSAKPFKEAFDKQKLCALFQMTYIGAPMIYYGDEAGMWGANDPDCRKPMVWSDIKYSNEKYLPDQSLRNEEDTVKVNEDLLAWYKKVIALRNNHKALQLGTYQTMLADDNQNIYGFAREFENEKIVVLINMNLITLNISSDVFESHNWYDLLTGDKYEGEDKEITVAIPPQGIVVLKRDSQ